MSDVAELGDIVGKALTDDLAGKLAVRAAKVAVLGAEHLLPSQDGSLGVVDLDNPLFHGDGYNTKLLAAGTYTKAPELFYGPFMQLGSYLKGKGAIQSDALALGLDVLGPDPINLLLPGTGGLIEKASGGLISGLTASGKVAKLASAYRDVHGALTGAELVTHVADTLEAAAKLSGAGEEVLKAAQAGKSGAALDLIKAALDSGKVSEEDAALLAKLRASGGAMDSVMKNAEAIAAKGVIKDTDYLGATIGERVGRGQVNPFLRVAKPDLARPWNIPLQMMGFETKGQTYWMPGATNMAAGLEKAAASPGLSAYNATVGLSIQRVLTGVPQDQLFRDFEASGIKDADLAARFRAARQLSPKTEVEGTPDFVAWKERLLDRFTGLQRAYDQASVRRANDTIQQSVAALEGLRPGLEQALASGAIQQDYAAQMGSMLRRLYDDMGVRSLRRDMGEPGFGIPARQSFATLIAHQTVSNTRSIIEQGYTGPLLREAVAELFGPATAHPSLWEEVGGRMVLKGSAEDIAKESPFLAGVLERATASDATRGLEARLRTEGLDAGVTHVVNQTRLTLDAMGKNLLHEGVVQGLLHDYFPRVFRPNDKFFKEFGGSVSDASAAMERLFASDDGDLILANLTGHGIKEQLDKAGQGKLSMAEARVWTEKVAQRMEAGGYGIYKKDGPELLGHYLEAGSSALLLNRVLHDLPTLGGALTFNEMAARVGSKEAAKIPNEAFHAATRVMAVDSSKDIPKELRAHYTRIDPRYRSVPAARDTDKLLATATIGAERDAIVRPPVSGLDAQPSRIILDQSRATVASRLGGEFEVGGVHVRGRDGKPRAIEEQWVRTGRVPSTVQEPASVRAAIQDEIRKDALEASREMQREARIGSAESASNLAHKARPQVAKELWVFTPDYNHLQQALHLYSKGEGVPAWLRSYRDWNYRFKSILLAGDIYHLNTLAFSQLLTDPASALKVLATSKGVKRAAMGAAGGAALGLATGRSAQGVAGLSLAGALYGSAITAALERAGEASHIALNPGNVDTLYEMGRGGWIGKPDDRAIGIAAQSLKALRDRLATDVAQGAVKPMLNPIDKVRHLAEAWETQLWEVMHNGSKHFYFDTVWRRELPKLEAKAEFQPEALKAEFEAARSAGTLLSGDSSASKFIERRQRSLKDALAREVVQSANNTMGGQNWANLLSHPEYQRTARDFLLSPDWTGSRMAMTSTYLMNMGPMKRAALGAGLGTAIDYISAGGDPDSMHPARSAALGAGLFLGLGKWADGIQRRMMVPGDVMAKEAARMSAAALLGGYTMANALNYAFTGHFMFANDEGRKTQIGMGDGAYVALGKPWVEAFEFAGVYHPEKYPAPIASRLFSKAAPIPHAVLRVMTNTNDWGGPLIAPDDGPLDIAYKDMSFAIDALAPIGLQGVGRVGAALTTGQFDPRQLEAGTLRTAGFQASVPMAPRGMGNLLGNMPTRLPALGDPGDLLAGAFR